MAPCASRQPLLHPACRILDAPYGCLGAAPVGVPLAVGVHSCLGKLRHCLLETSEHCVLGTVWHSSFSTVSHCLSWTSVHSSFGTFLHSCVLMSRHTSL